MSERRGVSKEGICALMGVVCEVAVAPVPDASPSLPPSTPPPPNCPAPQGHSAPALAGRQAVDPMVVWAALAASPKPAEAEDQSDPLSVVASVIR